MIETERLILRRPAARDIPAHGVFMGSDRAAMNGGPLVPGRAWRAFATHLGAWEIHGWGMFVYTFKGDDTALGMVGPWFPLDWPEREIGWNVWDPANEGKGLVAEAARGALGHLFGTLGWDTVVSYVNPANIRSRALAERLGAVIDPQATPPQAEVTPLVYRHPKPEAA